MVSLYIDGTPLVLPSDFSTEIKIENSFFTKNGEYTYDFKIPLNNPVNAALYAHLHRLNNVSEIKEKRQAVLMADNRCYINGTEIITDWTDDSVSIQLASGNSELNYLIGANLQVSFLEMGVVELGTDGGRAATYSGDDTDDDAANEDGDIGGGGSSSGGSGGRVSHYTQSLYHNYPDYDFVAAPVSTPAGILNEWRFGKTTSGYSLRLADGTIRIVQPYLCAIVRRMLNALGYTIGVNQLEDSRYSQLIVVHDVNTLEYAKMLPGWNVKDFFENLERMFNLVLVVNNRNRTVDIIFANRFYLAAEEVHLSAVEDEYEVETDEDNANLMTNANIGYDLPDSEYFRFAKMNESLVNMCEKVELPSLVTLGLYFQGGMHTRTIGIDTSTGRQYVYRPYQIPIFQDGLFPMREVNQYANLDKGGEEVLLKFIPCAQVFHVIPCYDAGGERVGDYLWMLPSIEGNTSTEGEDVSGLNMSELIESGKTESSNTGSGRLSLAFWHGVKTENAIGPTLPIGYPLVMSDSMFQVLTEQLEGAPMVVVDSQYSLRLPVLDAELYSGVYDIDTTKSYKFYTSDPNLPDARLIFVIRNKRFVCREMNFNIAQGEKQKRWCLTCYPINIADTEAYKRWILTDGKWRDGGVWLDDGRWLD